MNIEALVFNPTIIATAWRTHARLLVPRRQTDSQQIYCYSHSYYARINMYILSEYALVAVCTEKSMKFACVAYDNEIRRT